MQGKSGKKRVPRYIETVHGEIGIIDESRLSLVDAYTLKYVIPYDHTGMHFSMYIKKSDVRQTWEEEEWLDS